MGASTTPSVNPVIARLWRGQAIESLHRGAWVVVDTNGVVVAAAGDPDQQVFARSSTKSLQALPMLESGAADQLGVTDAELALAVSSHNGEQVHVDTARRMLGRAGFDESHLQCGPQRPAGAGIDHPPAHITDNCSGKHAGFLITARALGDDPVTYLDPASRVQQRVRDTVMEMTGTDASSCSTAIDGCSAPTFRLPLRALATGMARLATPDDLETPRAAACRRILAAARAHPHLIGGTSPPRFDTDVIAHSDGQLFAKSGAEGVQTLGIVGSSLGFAAKVDDGAARSLAPLTLAVMAWLGHLDTARAAALAAWSDPVRRNRAGLEIGRHQIVEAGFDGGR